MINRTLMFGLCGDENGADGHIDVSILLHEGLQLGNQSYHEKKKKNEKIITEKRKEKGKKRKT